jgi:hypothetical protein
VHTITYPIPIADLPRRLRIVVLNYMRRVMESTSTQLSSNHTALVLYRFVVKANAYRG